MTQTFCITLLEYTEIRHKSYPYGELLKKFPSSLCYCGYINSVGYRINHFWDTFKSKSWKFSSYPKFQKSIVLWKISKAASFQMVVNSQMCIRPPCHSRHVKSPTQSWWQRLWQWREKAVRGRYAAQGTQVTFSWWKK